MTTYREFLHEMEFQRKAIADAQFLNRFQTIIDDQLAIYNRGRTVQVINDIPDTNDIPIEIHADKPTHWLKIPDVICVFVDMKGSTQLSANSHEKSTAGAYQLFTGTAVRIFSAFEAPYIDVKGDGVFAMFNRDQAYRALAATITFKTFATVEFNPRVKKDTGIDVGVHCGIDQKTVLVRRLGLKRVGGRTDRQNEVWAGKPVNMASKLAATAEDGQLLVSDRYFKNINHELVRKSCGCPDGEQHDLWKKQDVSESTYFDFDTAYLLNSPWCATHGARFCADILKLDKEGDD